MQTLNKIFSYLLLWTSHLNSEVIQLIFDLYNNLISPPLIYSLFSI